MSLQTALTGLMAAQTGIDTTSNNLANADTTAYKSETSLFESLFPQEGSGDEVPGIGAEVEGISTNLAQGSLSQTGNSLDAAIQGNGYFVVSNNGVQQYSRDGAFQLNSTGQIENLNGGIIQGYQNVNGVLSSSLGPITINTGSVPATATSNVGMTLNLDSGATVPTATPFNPTNSSSYNNSTSIVAYDSAGNANRVQLYTVYAGSGSWQVYAVPETSDGTQIGNTPTKPLTTLTFNSNGVLTSSGSATLSNVNWQNGSAASNIDFNFTGTTSQAQSFAVTGLTNNGSAPGTYSGVSIASDGSVKASYTNGQTVSEGKIALATFLNPGSLTPITGNLYAANSNSGQAVIGQAGTGQAGTLAGGELEASNVSTSNMLVSLIQYQQAYEANTSVIQTEQQDSQRLLQI